VIQNPFRDVGPKGGAEIGSLLVPMTFQLAK
jgi:hypothetical protein